MKNKLLLLFFVFVILGAVTLFHYSKNYKGTSRTANEQIPTPTVYMKSARVIFENTTVNAEVVDKPASKEKGLSYRKKLADNSGMLFVFETLQTPIFWMKEMNFPIDIIWLKDNVIVDIDKNVPIPDPETSEDYLPKYSPKEKVNYVLEVNAGYVEKNKIKVGDTIDIRY